jgi:glucose-6-phosphate 1-dehydrogenase
MIFGSTGDLTYHKLIPALLDLYKARELCETFRLVCIGRRGISREEYLSALPDKVIRDIEFINFKKHIVYHQMDFSGKDIYESLKVYDMSQNWIFYLATAPKFFRIITEHLHDFGYLDESGGYKRIVFEKPFGVNFTDAKDINRSISKIVGEGQVYRIDHYLGKEMVQNILLTRVYNSFIEMLWNKAAIENIEIVISESVGVKDRGAYYDQSGALKDMVQNHMFQIVALLAMDLPDVLIPETIRDEKTKILKKIHLTDDIVLGQYDGYQDEKNVDRNSNTETFVAMKLYVHNKRWHGVPFYLKTGKALKEKYAHIVIRFKANKGQTEDNLLVIQVQPEEGIFLQMNSKKPGISNDVTTVTMDYCHSCLKYGSEPDAYGRLLLDVMLGDKSLFASWSEIESSWVIIDQVETMKANSTLKIYERNSEWDQQLLLEKGWWKHD